MTVATPPAKPLLRGWSHALAGLAAVGVTLALGWQTQDDPPRLVSLLVYGTALVGSFATSAVYHLGSWQGPRRTLFRALDHAGIFVVIAGTYTPFCVNVLSGGLRVALLGLIWALAALGVALSVTTLSLPRWATAALYVGMGWVSLVATTSLLVLLPLSALASMALGGLLYTLGAVVYARQWPDPLPRVFGFHEVFHLLVIAASATFIAVIWTWVVPFPRS